MCLLYKSVLGLNILLVIFFTYFLNQFCLENVANFTQVQNQLHVTKSVRLERTHVIYLSRLFLEKFTSLTFQQTANNITRLNRVRLVDRLI
jgi:hypothetical protein